MIRGAGHDITTAACGELIDVDTNLSEESGGGQRQATSDSCKTRIDRTGTTYMYIYFFGRLELKIPSQMEVCCTAVDRTDWILVLVLVLLEHLVVLINEIVLKAF